MPCLHLCLCLVCLSLNLLVMPMTRMLFSASTPSMYDNSWFTTLSPTPVSPRVVPRALQIASTFGQRKDGGWEDGRMGGWGREKGGEDGGERRTEWGGERKRRQWGERAESQSEMRRERVRESEKSERETRQR